MSAWNEPELLNSTLKCNFCDQLKFDMTLRYYYYYYFKLCKKNLVYQHAKYHYYMSVTFSLSLPNVELIRVHMF